MKKIVVFLIALFILLPIGVSASVIEYNICIPEHGAYHVSYNDEVSTKVSKEKITIADILSGNGHITYPNDISESDKEKYSFTANRFAPECTTTSDGSISSCPTANQYGKYDVIDKYVYNNDNYIKFSFNENTGKFTVKIIDAYNNKLSFRYVSDGRVVNENYLNVSNYSNQLLTRTSFKNSDGNNVNGYVINNVDGSKEDEIKFLTVEVYVNDGQCSGSFLASFSISMPVTSTYKIKNPALTYSKCDEVKAYKPTGMSDSEFNGVLYELKKNIVHQCYDSEIMYKEKDGLLKIIDENFDKLKAMFSNYTNVVDNSTIKCNKSSTNKKLVNTIRKNYWAMNIYEEYIAQGDTPKLVKAGSGFEYQTNYTVIRTYQIVQIAKPSKADECKYKEAHGGCSWTRNDGSTGTGWDAGPNDNFDDCVKECDGGKYTQSCINSCYKTVYGPNRDLSFSEKFIEKNNGVIRTASCITENGNPGTLHQTGDDQFCVSNWCEKHSYSCQVIKFTYPAGCSSSADSDYNKALQASQDELNILIAMQDDLIPVGDYEYQITDTYLKDGNGKYYVYKVSSVNDPKVNVASTQSTTYSSTKVSVPLGNDPGSWNVSFSQNVVVTSKIVVSLPLSHSDRVNGNIVYSSDTNSKYAFSIDHKNNKFDSLNFVADKYYNMNKERKYYTSNQSPNTNVVIIDNEVSLIKKDTDYNIKVVSSNVGDGKFSSNISCYYGVYRIGEDEDDPTTKGRQYIYRTIDLEDVFPNNRNPRWNWTGTLNSSTHTGTDAASFADQNSLKYNINPVRLTQEIESKGYTIYDVKSDPSEVDYEFVLTSENIRNIRNYNKKVRDYNGDGYNNYADYNMSCYKNSKGKEVCTSKFLDNISGNSGSETDTNFITYSVSGFNIQARKNLAGCNNSKSGACVEIGS